MKNQNSTWLSAVLLGGMVVLAGCTTTGGQSSIASVKFDLPKQTQWTQVSNQTDKDGNMLAVWIPKGAKPATTQVRVIHQKFLPASTSGVMMGKVVSTMQKNCSDVKVTPYQSASKYPDQISNEIFCARLGNAKYGTVTYNSVFTDKDANHLISSEVKIPASDKAGELNFKTEKEKKQAQNSSALAKVMFDFMNTIRICESENNCS